MAPEELQPETDIVADAPMVERSKTHLNAEQHALITELLRPGASIEAVIPEDATPDELWQTLDACVRGLNLLEARSTRISFIIGKLLTIFERKPSLYKDLGYDTWSDFIRIGVAERLGLHHSTTYAVRRTVENWPQLTPDRYAEIGPKNMEVLNKFTTGRTPSAEAWLDTAKRMKVSEFKEYVEQRGFLAPGESTGATFSLTTNRNRLGLFNEFFGDGRVHSYVGSKDKDRILEAVIQEVYQSWINQHEAAREEARRKAHDALTETVNA